MNPTAHFACAMNSWCFESLCQRISGTPQRISSVISFLYLCLKLECTYLDAFGFWTRSMQTHFLLP